MNWMRQAFIKRHQTFYYKIDFLTIFIASDFFKVSLMDYIQQFCTSVLINYIELYL